MIFSDVDIKEALQQGEKLESLRSHEHWIRVEPCEPWQVQPASIDLCLGRSFVCFPPGAGDVDMLDRAVSSYPVDLGSGQDSFFTLDPQTFVLGTTIERVELGPRVCGKIEGKSSIGRMGLIVHVTAGFIDPGFSGQITLELYNVSARKIRLRPDLPICQIAFGMCKTRAARPYGTPGLGSRYQNQAGAQPVRP